MNALLLVNAAISTNISSSCYGAILGRSCISLSVFKQFLYNKQYV